MQFRCELNSFLLQLPFETTTTTTWYKKKCGENFAHFLFEDFMIALVRAAIIFPSNYEAGNNNKNNSNILKEEFHPDHAEPRGCKITR